MKNLGKLKLKQLKKEELERREMNALKVDVVVERPVDVVPMVHGLEVVVTKIITDTNLISSITVKIIGYR